MLRARYRIQLTPRPMRTPYRLQQLHDPTGVPTGRQQRQRAGGAAGRGWAHDDAPLDPQIVVLVEPYLNFLSALQKPEDQVLQAQQSGRW